MRLTYESSPGGFLTFYVFGLVLKLPNITSTVLTSNAESNRRLFNYEMHFDAERKIYWNKQLERLKNPIESVKFSLF